MENLNNTDDVPKISESTNEKIINKFNEFAETDYTDEDVNKVLGNEDKINKKANKGHLAKYAENIKLFFSMLKDYFARQYTDISRKNIAIIIFTLIYIFSPLDILPDFLPFVGLLDDAILIGLCVKAVYDETEKYKVWKENLSKEVKTAYEEETE